MKFTSTNLFIFLIPFLFGYTSSALCDMKESGKNLKTRPPAWVFPIIWFVLFGILGYTWVKTREINTIVVDVLFFTNTILMFIWVLTFSYSCINNKKNGLYILLLIFISSLSLIICSLQNAKFINNIFTPHISTYLLLLYTGWILYALMLNYSSVRNNK